MPQLWTKDKEIEFFRLALDNFAEPEQLFYRSDSRKRENRKNTIEKEQFLEWTKSVWTFPDVSAKKIGHPAPFPEELPFRLIQLYSFKDDVVLDPFVGRGIICLAAVKTGRNFIGYDNNPDYVKLAENRIKSYTRQESLFDKEL